MTVWSHQSPSSCRSALGSIKSQEEDANKVEKRTEKSIFEFIVLLFCERLFVTALLGRSQFFKVPARRAPNFYVRLTQARQLSPFTILYGTQATIRMFRLNVQINQLILCNLKSNGVLCNIRAFTCQQIYLCPTIRVRIEALGA